MMNKQRFERVVENMKKLELSQILVADDPSIFYLTGRIVNPMERCGAILVQDTNLPHLRSDSSILLYEFKMCLNA